MFCRKACKGLHCEGLTGLKMQINGIFYFKIIKFFYSLNDLLIGEAGAHIAGADSGKIIGRKMPVCWLTLFAFHIMFKQL